MSTRQVEGILSSTLTPAKPLARPLEALQPARAAVDAADLLSPAQNAVSTDSELPPELADVVWRGNELGHGRTPVVAAGFAALDAELPDGGWPSGAMTEILQSQPTQLEWRLVGPCLRSLVAGGRSVVVIGPPKPPHLPGLRHVGLGVELRARSSASLPQRIATIPRKRAVTAQGEGNASASVHQ